MEYILLHSVHCTVHLLIIHTAAPSHYLLPVYCDLSFSDSCISISPTRHIFLIWFHCLFHFCALSLLRIVRPSCYREFPRPTWTPHLWMIADMILFLLSSFLVTTQASLHNFLELGAMPDDLSDIAAWHNGRLLNDTLAALQPGGFRVFFDLLEFCYSCEGAQMVSQTFTSFWVERPRNYVWRCLGARVMTLASVKP